MHIRCKQELHEHVPKAIPHEVGGVVQGWVLVGEEDAGRHPLDGVRTRHVPCMASNVQRIRGGMYASCVLPEWASVKSGSGVARWLSSSPGQHSTGFGMTKQDTKTVVPSMLCTCNMTHSSSVQVGAENNKSPLHKSSVYVPSWHGVHCSM